MYRCFFDVFLGNASGIERVPSFFAVIDICDFFWFTHSGIHVMLELACFSQVEKLCLFNKPMQSYRPYGENREKIETRSMLGIFQVEL